MRTTVPSAGERQFNRFLTLLQERGELEKSPETFEAVLGKLLTLQKPGKSRKRAVRTTPKQNIPSVAKGSVYCAAK